MSGLALVNGRVVLPDAVASDKAVLVDGATIAAIVGYEAIGPQLDRIDVGGRFIAPGLVDIHIHGADGHSFNEPENHAYDAITKANMERGVTAILATVSTAPIPDMIQCLEFSRNWMRETRDGSQVLGVHLEGPYLSMEQKGAQDPACIRMPDDGTVEELLHHHDTIAMMTYAPELPGSKSLTAQLVELGIVPAAGHSSATEDEVLAAMQAGLCHTIHIWSGQSSVVREGPWRKPGLLEATLVFDGLTGEMIADNRHLPPTLMKLAYKCKGAGRLCVVSDATSGAGLPDRSHFRMGEMEYEVFDGVGMLPDHTSFAGSTTLLNEMIPVLTDIVDVPIAEAVRMASLTPAQIVGCDNSKGSLEAGKDADIAVFEDDFTAWRVMIGGKWVHPV